VLFVEGLLERLGLAEQTKAKTMRYAGSEMLEHVINGTGKELAFSPVTEILLYVARGCNSSVRCQPKFRISPPTLHSQCRNPKPL